MSARIRKAKKEKPVRTPGKYGKYIDYIKGTGNNPMIEWFDDDWAPIGHIVRAEMEEAGLIKVKDGRIYLKK